MFIAVVVVLRISRVREDMLYAVFDPRIRYTD